MANKEQGYGRYKGRVAHTKRRIGGAKLAGGAGGGEVRREGKWVGRCI